MEGRLSFCGGLTAGTGFFALTLRQNILIIDIPVSLAPARVNWLGSSFDAEVDMGAWFYGFGVEGHGCGGCSSGLVVFLIEGVFLGFEGAVEAGEGLLWLLFL